MAELRRRDLIQPIRDYIASGRPFLGICLGLQLLFETGEEGGEHEGMGVLPGRCVRFRLPHEYKVPHMGWNSLQIVQREPLFVGIPDGTYFYFVHSYHVEPSDRSIIAATSDYGGPFCAAIARKNLFAVQFHPEKSQAVGQRLLANFAALPETN
jgi:glutamine amidotransferase